MGIVDEQRHIRKLERPLSAKPRQTYDRSLQGNPGADRIRLPNQGDFQLWSVHAFQVRSSLVSAQAANKRNSYQKKGPLGKTIREIEAVENIDTVWVFQISRMFFLDSRYKLVENTIAIGSSTRKFWWTSSKEGTNA